MATVPSISGIVNQVHADSLLANAQPPIAPAAGGGIPGLIGESSKAIKQAPPYAIWIPTHDRYGPPEPQGPSPAVAAGNFPRALRTRWCGFEVHLNCLQTAPTDFDTMDLTVNSFVAALHRNLHPYYVVRDAGLAPTFGLEIIKDRKVYLLKFEVATPITETTTEAVLAQILTEPINAGISTPTNPPK